MVNCVPRRTACSVEVTTNGVTDYYWVREKDFLQFFMEFRGSSLFVTSRGFKAPFHPDQSWYKLTQVI